MPETLTIAARPQPAVRGSGYRKTPTGRAALVRLHPADVSDCLIELCEAETRIGRAATCEAMLADDDLLPEHAVIETVDGEYLIRDLGSGQGTFVNDTPVSEQTLTTGDRIRLGSHLFKFVSGDRFDAQYHEAVYEMMILDGPTGAHNPRYFEDAFAREILKAQRHWRPVTLFLLNIDHFRTVNQQFGRLAGNDCLKGFCDRVCSRIRGEDLFARIEGDEFALSLSEAPLKQSVRVAQDLRRLVESQPFLTAQGPVELTVSIGVGFANGDGPITSRELLLHADETLRRAKSDGRNCVRF